MPDREKLRALTPEQRMRCANCRRWVKRPRDKAVGICGIRGTETGASEGCEHFLDHDGAAAIEAALAEQRARIVAYLRAEFEAENGDGGDLRLAASLIFTREPEAWAERTGWKMEETPDA